MVRVTLQEHWHTGEKLIEIYVDDNRHQQYAQAESLTIEKAKELLARLTAVLQEAETTQE